MNQISPRVIRVELGDRSYPVYLGPGTLGLLGGYCASHGVPKNVIVLADRNSARAAMRRAAASLRAGGFTTSSVVFPAGEKQKSVARAEAILSAMLRQGVPRGSGVIALGGGVVGDVAGLVASTYRRGLALVQCPTTLLSQVDSSVGGKNGVNLPSSKNAVGTYLQPHFVCADVTLLSSLPRREVVTGIGEILKYPLVGDPELLSFLEDHLDELVSVRPDVVVEVASRCLTVKARLVSEDERELESQRGRVLLNVGHAVGHALESLSRYRLHHGEAVLLGILAEGHIALRRGEFPRADFDRLIGIVRRLRPRFDLSGLNAPSITRAILGKGPARFVLPRNLGDVVVVHDVTGEEIRAGWKFTTSLL